MTTNLTDMDGINWAQVVDLLGDETDQQQMAVLAKMWRDMVADLTGEWDSIARLGDDLAAAGALHRVRGVVAMWGMEAVAARMLACEIGATPQMSWRAESEAVGALRDRGILAIERRYPALKTQG